MKKRALAAIVVMILFGAFVLHAGDPDDAYLDFYTVLKQADKLSTNGSPQEAKLRYQQAEVALRNLQKTYPDYNRELIQYRGAYVERRLDQLSSSNKLNAAQPPSPTPAPAAAPAPAQTPQAPASAPAAATPSHSPAPDPQQPNPPKNEK